jgi:mono/diheme cytochrome c family protein
MNYPQTMVGDAIDEELLLALGDEAQLDLGRVLFMYHCNDCHADRIGLSALSHLQRGWDEDYVGEVVRNPEKVHFFMPPWQGTEEEAVLLIKYLMTITPEYPRDMHFGGAKVGE